MATTIITKNGSGAPTADDLSVGELAVDLTNKRLYSKNSSSEVIELGVNTASSLDVTGTVTADGLTVEGAVTSNTVDGALLNWDGADASLQASRTAGNYSSVSIKTTDGTMRTRLSVDYQGNISFYEDTGTTAKLVWKASDERLGIGTTSPNALLNVQKADVSGFSPNTSYDLAVLENGTSATGAVLQIVAATDGVSEIGFSDSTRNQGLISYAHSSDAMIFHTNGSERARIDSNGDMSMANEGEIFFNASASSQETRLGWKYGGTLQSWIEREHSDGSLVFGNQGSERMRLDSSGNVGIGTDGPTSPLDVLANAGANALSLRTRGSDDYSFLTFRSNDGTEDLGGPAIYRSAASTSNLLFYTNNGGSAAERMRIDSSGNLLVGSTTLDQANNSNTANCGINLLGSGIVSGSTNSATTAYFNRLAQDGEIVSFRKNGSPVGSIGTANGDSITIGNSTGNLILYAGTVAPASTSAGGASNGAVDLGAVGRRFKDLYLSGGVWLGGTAAANYLDDYEEGTSSATSVIGITATTNTVSGRYTKIGNTVIEHFQLTISGKSGGSGNPYLGLSFTPSGNQGASLMQGGSIGKDTVIGSSLAYMGIYGSSPNVYANTLSGSYIGQASWTDGQLCFTVIYETN